MICIKLRKEYTKEVNKQMANSANETGQDSLQDAGRTSAEEGGSPSTQAEKTYTEAQVAQRHSKLDKMISQLTRERDTLKEVNKATQQQLADIQKRKDEQEEEEARSNPDSLEIYKKKRALRDLESQLNERQKQFETEKQLTADKLKRFDELEAENVIISKALLHHVDIGELKTKVQKFNLTTDEQIAEMASTLASSSKKLPPKGDSGLSVGGGTDDNLKARFPSMFPK